MSGEMEIITTLAKDNVLKGDSEINAIENARKQFEFALDEALNYDFSKNNRKRSKIKKSNEELIKEGDFDTLLKQNMGLVYKVADKYKHDLYYEDVIQECIATMYYAFNEYKEEKGAKFTTFVYSAMWKNSFRLICTLKGHIRNQEFIGYYENGNKKFKETHDIIDTLSYDAKMSKTNDDSESDFLSHLSTTERGYNFVEEKEWLEKMVLVATKIDNKRSRLPLERVVQMKLNGMSNTEIAKEFGVNKNAIRLYINRFAEYYTRHRGEFVC